MKLNMHPHYGNAVRFSPDRLLSTSGFWSDTFGSIASQDNISDLAKAGVQRGISEITGDDGSPAASGGGSAPASEPFYKTTTGMIVIGVGGLAAVFLIMKMAKKRRR
jgi:hypothetical protein